MSQNISSFIAPMFIGTSLADREQTLENVRQAVHGFGSTGAMIYDLSGIEIALWELAAKVAGIPLYALLGATRRTLGLYASLVSYGNDPDEVYRQICCARDLRYQLEDARIHAWLGRVQRLVRGYSDTHSRALNDFEVLMSAVDRHQNALRAPTLRELRNTALADEHGFKLKDCLDRHALTVEG
ncbi:hypothetical protein [Pseudomonas putida]